LPELVSAVNALGEPAMAFQREPERLYPQTTLAAHVLGLPMPTAHGVIGMEKVLDKTADRSGDARRAGGAVDRRARPGRARKRAGPGDDPCIARGAAGLILDVDTGEVLAMTSLPSFNPNKLRLARRGAPQQRDQSVYELGSTFKPLTIAAAIDSASSPAWRKRYDATQALAIGRFRIRDDHPSGRWLNVPETLIHSSNIVTARSPTNWAAKRWKDVPQARLRRPPAYRPGRRFPLWPRTGAGSPR
jgi:cell division protein FtsI (penicillin-binding protein 3)